MADFSKYCGNYTYTCTPLFFGKPSKEHVGGTMEEPVLADTGVNLLPNGDVSFRFFYPRAKEVVVNMRSGRHKMTLNLENDGTGLFSGVLPYEADPNWVGIRDFTLSVDGVQVVTSRAPIQSGGGGRIGNTIYVPDVEWAPWDEYLVKKVPHGTVSYDVYWSDVLQDWQRCMVYLPDEYYKNEDKKYPVLYIHHPGGGNETSWMFLGRVPFIMDNLIAEGLAEPFIVVSNECAAKTEADGRFGMDTYLDILIKDCIPFIDDRYHTKTDKWSRAAAGSSWGGMLSSRLVFSHPELFGSVGMLSSGLRCVDTHPVLEDNHYLDWMRGNGEEVGKQYKLIMRTHGEIEYTGRPGVPGENGNPTLLEDEVFLAENGIDKLPCYVRLVFPNYKHMWDTFSRGFYEFAKVLFK